MTLRTLAVGFLALSFVTGVAYFALGRRQARRPGEAAANGHKAAAADAVDVGA